MAAAGHNYGCQGKKEMPALHQKRYGPAYVVDLEARLARCFEGDRGRGIEQTSRDPGSRGIDHATAKRFSRGGGISPVLGLAFTVPRDGELACLFRSLIKLSLSSSSQVWCW